MTFSQINAKRELALRVEQMMDRSEYPSTAVISAMCHVIKQLCKELETMKHEEYERDYRP